MIDAIATELTVGNITQLTTAGRTYPLLDAQREWVFTQQVGDAKGKLLVEALARVAELEAVLRKIQAQVYSGGLNGPHPTVLLGRIEQIIDAVLAAPQEA